MNTGEEVADGIADAFYLAAMTRGPCNEFALFRSSGVLNCHGVVRLGANLGISFRGSG